MVESVGTETNSQPGHGSPAIRGFGPSILADCARRPMHWMPISGELPDVRRQVRQQVPVCPGVYAWLNSDSTIVYVGKAKSLRHRLTGYFATQTSDPKMARIRNHSSVLVWEPNSHELLALVREQELISRFRPCWNVQGKPERRQPGFVCLSRGAAPTIFFSGDVPTRAASAIGPIAGRGDLRAAIASLNHVFQLRDCPDKTRMQFSNQLQLFDNSVAAGCLRHELSSCPAPCAGGCSRQAYHQNVERASRFLSGRDATILSCLESRMKEAAGNLAFERATVLRDQLTNLKWMDRRIRQLTTARRKLNGAWVLPGFDHQSHWMILRGGDLRCCVAAPPSAGGVPVPGEAIDQVARTKMTVPTTSLRVNWLLLLASWARRYPDQAKSVISFDVALEQSRTQKICA